MKAKIDKNGHLSLKKINNKLLKQSCPFDVNETPCGFWCPLFEIIKHDDGYSMLFHDGRCCDVKYTIRLCHERTYYFEETDIEIEV